VIPSTVQSPLPVSAGDEKVGRLVEMGFRREDAVEQLKKYGGDERSALNALLGL
jgi:hypothetical protein